MINGIIYCYTNIVNGKKYVGQTIQPKQRHYQHFWRPRLDDHHNYFHNAIAKYGKEVWKYEVLFETNGTREDVKRALNEKERFYIQELNTLYPNGYNMNDGGDSPTKVIDEVRQLISEKQKGNTYRLGAILSEDEKKKISLGVKEAWQDETIREKFIEATKTAMKRSDVAENVSKAQRKRFESPSQRELISKKTKDAMARPEVRKKLSEAAKGKEALNKIKVRQYDKEGNFLKEYESLTYASEKTHTNLGEISKVCRRKKWAKTAGGFIWRYSNDCSDMKNID